MRKLIAALLTVIVVTLFRAGPVSADVYVAGESAQLKINKVTSKDLRVVVLKKFLESHNSPLSLYSENFVEYADKYGIDYRLVPAISGVESTFGKRIPYKSYNAYGWANGEFRFGSWEESIEIVSKTLREKYFDRGATNIYSIGRRYAPPSKTWAGKVLFFMNKIDPYSLEFSLKG